MRGCVERVIRPESLEYTRVARSGRWLGVIADPYPSAVRTHPANGTWVAKLVAGRPQRLSRAMMETLAIVAYRQPITRPEIDEIRGVDCGPVLRTLLDRALIRVIGKKEEVGRPLLYGTTPDFLKTFNIAELTDLPTLRDFHELGQEDRDLVDSTHGASTAGPLTGHPLIFQPSLCTIAGALQPPSTRRVT